MQKSPILFFDGKCSLCNKSVDFFIEKDKGQLIRYAPLQGTTAKELLDYTYIQDLNTVVFYQNEIIYTKSEAIIRALIVLGPKYALTSIFLIIPGFIRDILYNLISKNRYRFWGKRETCRLPSQSEKKLFLD